MRILTVLIAAFAAASCGSKHEPLKPEASSGPVVPVKLAGVTEAEWPLFYDATGTVRARTSGQVSARIMAYVHEVRAKIGDRVRQGQTLLVLDNREMAVRQRQAEAARREAGSAAAEADQAIESARANLSLAEVTHKRMKDLFDRKSISNQELDEVTARLRMARSALDMAESRRKQVDAKIAQTEEEIKGVAIQTGYSTVTAPFAGVVTEKMVEPGNLAVPGAPLLTVEREGGYRLEASVEEASLPKVRLGQRVTVTLDSLDRTLDGVVSEIVPAVDPGSRSFIAKIDLPSMPNLRTGAFGRARFELGSRKSVILPVAAVAERGQMQWVFVHSGGRARGRIVTLGRRDAANIEVLSGIVAGESVIAPVPADLTDGARVEVRP